MGTALELLPQTRDPAGSNLAMTRADTVNGQTQSPNESRREQRPTVDEVLEDSFPASDPP